MEVVKKVCHNGADQDSACDSGRRTPSQAGNYLLQLKKGGVAKAKGEGEKEKECTTECKSRRRRDEKAPWALNYESGEGGGDAKGRRRGGEKRAMYV